QRKDVFVKTSLADRELSRMYADGEAARACIEVVARQRPLPTRVETALGVERLGMGGNDRALLENCERGGLDLRGGFAGHHPYSGPATAKRRSGLQKGVEWPCAMRVKLRWRVKPRETSQSATSFQTLGTSMKTALLIGASAEASRRMASAEEAATSGPICIARRPLRAMMKPLWPELRKARLAGRVRKSPSRNVRSAPL